MEDELQCHYCGNEDVTLIEEYEELGVTYKEYDCNKCGEQFMEEFDGSSHEEGDYEDEE